MNFGLIYVMLYFTMTPIVMNIQLKLKESAMFSPLYEKSVIWRFLHNDSTWWKTALLSAPVFCSNFISTNQIYLNNNYIGINSKLYWILRSPYLIIYFQCNFLNILSFYFSIFDLKLYRIANFQICCICGFVSYAIQLFFGIRLVMITKMLSRKERDRDLQIIYQRSR